MTEYVMTVMNLFLDTIICSYMNKESLHFLIFRLNDVTCGICFTVTQEEAR